ncbi:MAG TPA: right-handed parallel beta-helix repeat-containing protein, partial [Saprospiraceae bacterium]|nr:right-handed parallel beta-helix repeat-containing protein [Saprospiraceae bacterium]
MLFSPSALSYGRLLGGVLFLALLLLAVAQSACRKEKFSTDPADRLAFSTDTLRFDTVFTQLGSATRILKLYNRHRESIRVSRIYLENGAASRFNLNVDGIAGDDQRDLEIAPNDSMYVFVEVTINPNDQSSPFVLTERVVFETNGNTQHVVLEAWGQNAIYLPSRFGAGGAVGYGCNGGEWVWNDPRPYVIYGILVIDSCTVRIPAGARVYVHGGLGRLLDTSGAVLRYNDGYLAFQGAGRLIVEGTQEKPVIFESDRLEEEFDDDPGQWVGIWLQKATTGHRIEHCIIRNSIIGVRVDSAADLRLSNTQIYRTTSPALIGLRAKIEADNCLFYDNGGYCIQLEWGGDYRFSYCTAASVGIDGDALRLSNALCLDQQCLNYSLHPLRARFQNCIFYGSRADQITLFDRESNPQNFDYEFKNCLVRVKDLLKANQYPDFFDHCQPCRNVDTRDTIFLDVNKDNYRLDT